VGLEFQSFIGEAFAFGVVAAGDRTLCSRDVGVHGFARLAHGLVAVSYTHLDVYKRQE